PPGLHDELGRQAIGVYRGARRHLGHLCRATCVAPRNKPYAATANRPLFATFLAAQALEKRPLFPLFSPVEAVIVYKRSIWRASTPRYNSHFPTDNNDFASQGLRQNG